MNFIVSGLTFNSLMHLSLFLCIVYGKGQFHSFTCVYQILPTPFVEEIILFPLYVLDTLVKDFLTIYTWIFFWTLFCSISLYVFHDTNTILF